MWISWKSPRGIWLRLKLKLGLIKIGPPIIGVKIVYTDDLRNKS